MGLLFWRGRGCMRMSFQAISDWLSHALRPSAFHRRSLLYHAYSITGILEGLDLRKLESPDQFGFKDPRALYPS